MRWMMLDRITEVVRGELARGLKCVTLTDEVLHDHFPDHPILPGVLVIEAAAQLAGFLVEVSLNAPGATTSPRRAILVQVDKVKFHRPAVPGDSIALVARLTGTLEGAARVEVEADVAGDKAMRGVLTFMLEHVDSERVHEQRRSLYRLWTRGLGTEVWIP